MGNIPKEVNERFRNATRCNSCFEGGIRVERSFIDVPQPRLIGRKYWGRKKRILLLLINPGSGSNRRDTGDETHRNLIHLFRSGQGTIESIFSHQRGDIQNWGKFVSFYCGSLGLYIDDLAIVNVAWCGTVGDKYPTRMLENCFARHTAHLIQLLDPGVILIGGIAIHVFAKDIQTVAPKARLILTPHYAHREGAAFEQKEAQRIRAELAMVD